MDISRIIKNILLEEETFNIEKINYQDQYQVLELGLKNCPSLKNWIPEANNKIKELSADKTIYFPQLNAPAGSIFYVSAPYQDGTEKGRVVLFGLPFKEGSGGTGRSFKAYTISNEGVTSIVAKGWGSTCEFFKETSQLGQEPLSADQYSTLESWLKRNGMAYSLKNPNSEEYKGVLVKDLKNASNGEPALPGYTGGAMVWTHQGLSNIGADQAKNLEAMLKTQMFTQDLSNIPMDSDTHDYAFYLSDVIKDLPQLDQVRSLVKNDILIYPLQSILIEPERGVCRTVISKLYDCSTKASTPGCRVDLFKNKLTAIRCSDKKFIGGTEDKFQKVASDSGTYGILNLINAKRRGLNKEANKAPTTVRENIRKRVFNILSEEIRKKK